MENEIILTKDGKKKLEERLDYLEKVKRLEVAEKIKEARSFGDLSENAEYDAAKEEQAIIESEIVEINAKLTYATIIDDSAINNKVVSLGCFVTVQEEGEDKEEYQIVGTTEANLDENRISNESPLGKALIGKKKGAEISVKAPNGHVTLYKILAIRV